AHRVHERQDVAAGDAEAAADSGLFQGGDNQISVVHEDAGRDWIEREFSSPISRVLRLTGDVGLLIRARQEMANGVRNAKFYSSGSKDAHRRGWVGHPRGGGVQRALVALF